MTRDLKATLRLHDDLARVMADERFGDGRRLGGDLRQFVIAYRWARFETRDRDEQWKRTVQLAGLTARRDSRWALSELYRADAPRYEPSVPQSWRGPRCPSPMLRGPRAGEPCGKDATAVQFRVTDPDTGEWVMQGWCRRHEADADAARRAERAKVITVEPMPNVGGLLPCYIRATNWPEIYTAASHGWKPPAVGIVADDWPVLAKVNSRRIEPPKLALLDGDSEASEEVAAIPALRLVTS